MITVLNDMCVFAPASLIDKRLSWMAIDDRTARVMFENGSNRVSAALLFNHKGELGNFVSDDRLALQDGGSLRRAKWSTAVGDCREIDGRKIPTAGDVIRHYPEGDFTYGRFRLMDIRYNVPGIEQ
jgi:hypothetical protein